MKLSGGQSRISIGRSMAKDQGEIDNGFTPYVHREDPMAMIGIVGFTIAAALFVAAFGLARTMGVL